MMLRRRGSITIAREMPTFATSSRLPLPDPRSPSRRRFAASIAVWRLLAIACLLVIASPSRAQGSVTLYGLIDTSIEVTNPGSGYVARMDSGAYRGTRFGLHGSEPLGDGNSLVFTLENGFDSAGG